MTRQVAFLRGVSPMNTRMPALKAAFEALGYGDVRTVLSSGNVVFSTAKPAGPALARAIETGLADQLSRQYPVIVRSAAQLHAVLDSHPFAGFVLAPDAKRVVTFLAQAPGVPPSLPITREGASILAIQGSEAFTAYVPQARGPVFMTLIERTFGKAVTTRTWDTLRKCVAACA